ncbi:anaerobic dimethyl sulfoxide reductase chain C [Leminorella grimontii]|uniref:Anaerobic dimethyl sulfoxide reductase chain C n=1 Tax=Leminorella grimontii TaxID=82981 RepID=A0AAV5MZE8_9GAMM|nr:DmsC/YnfH family molybdoenzyme membrane anchor subunit [Leminorella grimontii]KFC95655.1 anaerobic dimethyl sulfoxide reductase chain C [Leminorella grimontii ATCC 33999 = DSM 5078]GKX54164.1 anaerobic dimethyl sulfoxide reductase chain C [Leminorella grimontii]GKX60596.1 anaerobic dimethyl sulfoxide reductase chain C [Leminorella grimontii]VFS59880.1 DMSO reductase anchor subunit [Leminorella grimontii]
MSEYEFPLVFFTVLCQWAIGAIVAVTALIYARPAWLTDEKRFACLRKVAVGVFIVNVIGSLLSLLHLGTPTGAYRAILGIGHSWLSREVVAFFLLNVVAFFWTVAFVFGGRRHALVKGISLLTSIVGVAAILVSAQVYYQMGSHPMWHSAMTHLSFIATALLLGFASLSIVVGAYNVEGEDKGAMPSLLPMGILLGAIALLVVILWYGQGLVRQDQLMQSAIVLFSSGLMGWLIFGGVVTGTGTAVYLLRKPSISVATGGVLMLVVLSAAVCGRMLFYYGVMSQSPWF